MKAPFSSALRRAWRGPRLPGFLEDLIDAILGWRGDAREILREMSIGQIRLSHHLSVLRAAGVASMTDLFDPQLMGLELRARNLVRLGVKGLENIEAFEALLVRDPAVATADKIVGDYDYRITSYHTDRRAALDWASALLNEGAVHVEQTVVQDAVGHELAGFPIHRRDKTTTWRLRERTLTR
jgi:DNA-binding transcriptional ArsR family regulator